MDTSRVAALMPANKHGYATPQDIESGSLLLQQMAALLPKRSARLTTLHLLSVIILFLALHEL